MQLQQYEADLLQKTGEKSLLALADQKKKEETRLTGVDQYILNRNLNV